MKVLMADDSALLRKNLKKLLSSVAHISSIVESDTVESTLRTVKTADPDVIILDISLPDGSGFDVLEVLQQKEHRPLIIVLTNFATETNRKKSLAMGAVYFFDKSNEFEKAIGVLQHTRPPKNLM